MPKTSSKFNELNQQLAGIIEWFEAGSSDIEVAIENYEKASKIIAEIEKYLKTAENRLKKLKVKLD